MKLPALKRSAVTILASTVVMGAVTYVQHLPVPGIVENTIRSLAGKLGLLAVPILIILACRTWLKSIRPELPSWRNGLGLSSIVILFATWLVFAAAPILRSVRPSTMQFLGFEWTATLLACTEAAALLGIALKGASRIQGFAAAVLMWAWLQSTIYF